MIKVLTKRDIGFVLACTHQWVVKPQARLQTGRRKGTYFQTAKIRQADLGDHVMTYKRRVSYSETIHRQKSASWNWHANHSMRVAHGENQFVSPWHFTHASTVVILCCYLLLPLLPLPLPVPVPLPSPVPIYDNLLVKPCQKNMFE